MDFIGSNGERGIIEVGNCYKTVDLIGQAVAGHHVSLIGQFDTLACLS